MPFTAHLLAEAWQMGGLKQRRRAGATIVTSMLRHAC